jgi:hypothetical protein
MNIKKLKKKNLSPNTVHSEEKRVGVVWGGVGVGVVVTIQWCP